MDDDPAASFDVYHNYADTDMDMDTLVSDDEERSYG
jgi:hypothetical protein